MLMDMPLASPRPLHIVQEFFICGHAQGLSMMKSQYPRSSTCAVSYVYNNTISIIILTLSSSTTYCNCSLATSAISRNMTFASEIH